MSRAATFPVFPKMKRSTRDNLIYLGVGGIVAAVFAGYVFYTDRTMGTIPDIPGPILWGILSTPAIVALVLEQFWEHRRRRSLWVVCAVAALINVAGMFVAYSFRWEPPVGVWSVITVTWVTFVLVGARKFVIPRRGE
jgi:Na+/melibiose symporter-like transporter